MFGSPFNHSCSFIMILPSPSSPHTIPPQELVEGRLQLHYGIQCIAAIGAALAEPLSDQSHTSFTWNPVAKVFMGPPMTAATPFRVVLDPIALVAGLMDEQNQMFASQILDNKTLDESLDWHKGELAKLNIDTSSVQWLHYPSDFPDHPLAHGARFDAHPQVTARSELALYYASTFELLQEIVAATTAASPIRIWPHHFDMAILIDVPRQMPGKTPGTSMTIGLGLSPGDQSYPEPYWYVSPYPYPQTANLPNLAGNGCWHTQEWTGAVLTASRLTTDAYAARQSQIRTFLQSALSASQRLCA
jgi:hypothetical protein